MKKNRKLRTSLNFSRLYQQLWRRRVWCADTNFQVPADSVSVVSSLWRNVRRYVGYPCCVPGPVVWPHSVHIISSLIKSKKYRYRKSAAWCFATRTAASTRTACSCREIVRATYGSLVSENGLDCEKELAWLCGRRKLCVGKEENVGACFAQTGQWGWDGRDMWHVGGWKILAGELEWRGEFGRIDAWFSLFTLFNFKFHDDTEARTLDVYRVVSLKRNHTHTHTHTHTHITCTGVYMYVYINIHTYIYRMFTFKRNHTHTYTHTHTHTNIYTGCLP